MLSWLSRHGAAEDAGTYTRRRGCVLSLAVSLIGTRPKIVGKPLLKRPWRLFCRISRDNVYVAALGNFVTIHYMLGISRLFIAASARNPCNRTVIGSQFKCYTILHNDHALSSRSLRRVFILNIGIGLLLPYLGVQKSATIC